MKELKARFLIPALFITLLAGYLSSSAAAKERCKEWVAKVASVQGSVQVRRVGEEEWGPVKLNDIYCPGDTIRVQERSRAAVLLCNESILRLNQKTTIIFMKTEKKRTSLIDLLRGAVHFFTRIPRGLKVATPFVNGVVEGTEFFVEVTRDKTFLSVLEGRVLATNEVGSLRLTSGQSAVAQAGRAPVPRVVIRPRDGVQWALYYPPVLHYRPVDFPGGAETDWQAMVRRSIKYYWKGDLKNAFSSLEGVPEDIRDRRFFTYRAGLLLGVGRVEDATVDIERALNLDPRNSHAFALLSIIAVVQNRKARALELAKKAVKFSPQSPTARIALSYAHQAHFEVELALESLKEAVNLDPNNALAWSRLSELWLSVGNVDKALEAAQRGATLNPHLARTQTVLGFAYLTQIRIQDSKTAFEKAIQLDQAAPLPRLGLGLAKIREGDLAAGREEMEIAISLDPNNSLIRSYLGKAYFEEKRNKYAMGQFAIAKELDPQDPTPYFYDAIRKQTVNRPGEALHDLQKSIELNENRAIYRSNFLLDEDLAARSASLGRIHSDLGFQQMALVEGWKSVHIDPSNYSAHRFLADLYAAIPRHEIAKVSELLQSQLLQRINITPVQPQLAETNLFILEGAGPANPSFNEFNPLFLRDRLALQASGVIGGNDTLGDELVHSGVQGRFSYSLGQFHYETDGFRPNNDQEQDILNAFGQVELSHKSSLLAEIRHKDREFGDLDLLFDPKRFLPNKRQELEKKTYRLGYHHTFAPKSELIASVIGQNIDESIDDKDEFSTTRIKEETDGYLAEVQHLFRGERFNVISGVGYYDADFERDFKFTLNVPFSVTESKEERDIRHSTLYVYTQFQNPYNFTLTAGVSYDAFDDDRTDSNQLNPKIGMTWNPFPPTTLRCAVFRLLTRTLISDQTVEPTQVAGFNQFFNDVPGTDIWVYGGAVDHKFSSRVFGGAEFYKRDLEVPFEDILAMTPTPVFRQTDWEEYLGRAYLYWAVHPWFSVSAEYRYEDFSRGDEFPGTEQIIDLETQRLQLGGNFFHPSGFFARAKSTYVDQEGEFGDPTFPPTVRDEDQFWVFDAAAGYRLPRRFGFITIEGKNLFDEDFKFQDTDPANPTIFPERLILVRFTLAF